MDTHYVSGIYILRGDKKEKWFRLEKEIRPKTKNWGKFRFPFFLVAAKQMTVAPSSR